MLPEEEQWKFSREEWANAGIYADDLIAQLESEGSTPEEEMQKQYATTTRNGVTFNTMRNNPGEEAKAKRKDFWNKQFQGVKNTVQNFSKDIGGIPGMLSNVISRADNGKSLQSQFQEQQARLNTAQAAQDRAYAQKANQIANRDQRQEAEKDAASSAASQYQQNIAQMSGAAGAGAAALTGNKTVDTSAQINTHMQRGDMQRNIGHERGQQASTNDTQAVTALNSGSQMNDEARQIGKYNNQKDTITNPKENELSIEEHQEELNKIADNATKQEYARTHGLKLDIYGNIIPSDSRLKNIIKGIKSMPDTWR